MHSSLVLDAGAFYAGTSFLSSDDQLYTTSAVLEEVRHIKSQFSALEVLRESGRLVIQDPDKSQVEKVLRAAAKTGDRRALSEADISILALALQLTRTLVTDDYAIANVAAVLGAEVKPATGGKEIQETRRWIYYCSGCSRTFKGSEKECPLCGNKLKRKYKRFHEEL
ncbi:MAG: NOB1 family endonuclease [Nitrososphaera sp.]